MKLYTYYSEGIKKVYGMAINGKSYFFYKGFKSAEAAKKHILSNIKTMPKVWFETALEGEWSEIE